MRIVLHKIVAVTAVACCAVFFPETARGEGFCKWTDSDGIVHYAEECPEAVNSTVVETRDEQAGIGTEIDPGISRLMTPGSDRRQDISGESRRYRSLPLEELGPLPPHAESEYLKTREPNFSVTTPELTGRLVLFLESLDSVPEGAWVEAAFPDPADISRFNRVGESVGPGQKFMLVSPTSPDLKCWNYIVEVSIYSDPGKSERIGVHRQVIQSRVDLALARSSDDALQGVTRGFCSAKSQKDLSRMSVGELEALCLKEREKLLAPEREYLISQCSKRKDWSVERCERYYADHGDARRIDRFWLRPELYMNIPECAAAREAREKKR